MRDTDAVFTVHKADFQWLNEQNKENIRSVRFSFRKTFVFQANILKCRSADVTREVEIELQCLSTTLNYCNGKSYFLVKAAKKCPTFGKNCLIDALLLITLPVQEPKKALTEETFLFNEPLKENTSPIYDICLAYAPNGVDIAR